MRTPINGAKHNQIGSRFVTHKTKKKRDDIEGLCNKIVEDRKRERGRTGKHRLISQAFFLPGNRDAPPT